MKKKLAILIVIAVVIFNISFNVLAENINELQDKRNQVQSQLDGANNELGEVQSELSQMLQQIQVLNETISKSEEEVANLDNKISELQVNIEETEVNLEVAEEAYNKQKDLLEKRLIAIYEAGETKYLDVLLNSKSLTEFISNYYLITEITKCDSDLLEELESDKNEIQKTKTELDGKKINLKTAKANQERTAIVLKNTRAVKDNYMSKLTDRERTIQEQIDLYENQFKEVENEIKTLLVSNSNTQYIGGIMAWPVPGYTKITSQYGMRTHPITGVYKLHTGVDIGAPMGADFIAANDGIVVKAGYNGAYGKMVIIDHGGGISTLYAHGSEILVTEGQSVKKGDAILKVGSTGYSTGAHAHFEVRVGGTCVSPMEYITTSIKTEEENNE